MWPSHKDFHSSSMRTLLQKRETSVYKSLDRVHEAHQKASSAAAALEEEIEKLHQMKSRFQLGSKAQKSGSLEIRRNEGGIMPPGSFCK